MKKKMMTLALCSVLILSVPNTKGAPQENIILGSIELSVRVIGVVMTYQFLQKMGRKFHGYRYADRRDYNGRTFLMSQILRGESVAGDSYVPVSLLVRRSSVNAVDSNGMTALMCAAQVGDTFTIEELLKYGANINATDNTGKRALEFAAESGHRSLVRLLVSKDVQCKTKEKMGQMGLSEKAQKMILDEFIKKSVSYARILEAKGLAYPQIFTILSGVYGKSISQSDMQQKIREELLRQEVNKKTLKAKRAEPAKEDISWLLC